MSLVLSNEAHAEYEKYYKLGKKEDEGLLVLDELIANEHIVIAGEMSLGLVQIPVEKIAGTKTSGRGESFSKSFYPILPEKSEFAQKWMGLYQAHIEEGIREPVKAYEFMNKFYIEEGNKRVSVLKCLGAVSVSGMVTRIYPVRTTEKKNIIYYEFVDFYRLSRINYLDFSEVGSYARLQHLVGKRPDEKWSEDDRLEFSSLHWRFKSIYMENEKGSSEENIDDALLAFLNLYDYSEVITLETSELKEKILKSREELKLREGSIPELHMSPEVNSGKKKNILTRLLPTGTSKMKVAFIHESTPEVSSWTYAHELGRLHLKKAFSDEIQTVSYDGATEENVEALIEKCIEDGNNLIFTTSPPLLKGSLKAAIEHPDVKILNCSLNTSHKYIRTYHVRMYEAKFLMGAIAGAMTENDKIGYLADYPIYGVTANINAFALGAKMVNPRARVYLEWTKIKKHDPFETFREQEISYISGRDMIMPKKASRYFGLYWDGGDYPINLAMPVRHWGKFYEQMIRKLMKGSWKDDEIEDETRGLNYWWGMSAGAVDVICSRHLPIGTARLIELLKKTISAGDFNPFHGVLYSQQGIVQKDSERELSPEEIITMDWLAENVVGHIPGWEELVEQAKPVVTTQGLGGIV
ncbi:BMP family ABC transporter substrate-binding protein [Frisingicoccus sp.]|uniref:BMP family ABC transporter substrate-binding protein n=1 Tax=Frisingicoccus sp. TaxID=1918627 RepID=UPI002EA08724|nr:BMP family ABC transporter substrate-binding protein [Frisingicoccus sp.]